jgi:hypothetical protein
MKKLSTKTYFASLALATFTSGEVFADLEEKQVGKRTLTLQSEAGSNEVILTVSSAQKGETKLSSLPKPPRVVVDLNGAEESAAKSIEFKDKTVVRRVRVGVTKGKTRLVIDGAGDVLKYQGDFQDNTLKLTISDPNSKGKPLSDKAVLTGSGDVIKPHSDSQAKTKQQSDTKKEIAVITQKGEAEAAVVKELVPVIPTESATIAPTEPSKEVSAQKEVSGSNQNEGAPTITPIVATGSAELAKPSAGQPEKPTTTTAENPAAAKAVESDASQPSDSNQPGVEEKSQTTLSSAGSTSSPATKQGALPLGGITLQGVKFETLSPQSAQIIAPGLTKYSVIKFDERSYRITVQNITADPAVLMPHFPPKEFLGLTYISPRETKDGLEIRIGVENGTSLNILPEGNGLKLTVLKTTK